MHVLHGGHQGLKNSKVILKENHAHCIILVVETDCEER